MRGTKRSELSGPTVHPYTVILESLSSTSDTNTDTNNRLCACAVLEKGTVTSALEVATTEVKLFLEVVVRPGIS